MVLRLGQFSKPARSRIGWFEAETRYTWLNWSCVRGLDGSAPWMKFLTFASRLESLKTAGLSAANAIRLVERTIPMIDFIGCYLRKE